MVKSRKDFREEDIMFGIKTDEEFFERFRELGAQVTLLGGMFQNEGTEVSAGEVREWFKMYDEMFHSLKELKVASNNRMIKKD